MSPEAIVYPFLFLAIFFESFVLVTLLSKPARTARGRLRGSYTPSVAIIVPCWNEEETIASTVESLFALEYPADKLEIILVNDGSTDGTARVMERFADRPQVTIIHKENGGKHTALNAGVAATRAGIIGCLDADSFVEPDALREIIPSFTDARVAATTAAMSVHRPKNLLQHMQNAEYIFGIALRHTLASVNGIYVTPGPFSFYRREVVEKLGGFRHGYQTEDMEMALRLQKEGYAIENAPRARVYTKAPRTLLELITQRTRWTTGFMRNVLNDYYMLIGNRRHGALGMIVLPFGLVAVGGSIIVFFTMLYLLGRNTLAAFQIRAGIPLSYAFLPHGSFDWFFLPSNVYFLLALSAVITSLSLIVYGKRLSRTPGNVGMGLLSYLLLYGFVVPLWLLRSVADVAFGKRRLWR